MNRLWLLTISMAVLVTGSVETAGQEPAHSPRERIQQFLREYRTAFSSANPLLLAPYDPDGRVFGPLVASPRFDHIRRSEVALRHMDIERVGEGLYRIAFLKLQEDLDLSGLFTRGVARVEIEVRAGEEELTVLSHRTLAPAGSDESYRSTDPRTWGEEHSAVETHLFSGLEYLREGDLRSAEQEIEGALDMLEKGNIPKFLMGSAYFEAGAFYLSAMLKVKGGRSESALVDLERALTLHPEFPAALNLAAELLFAEAEYERAMEFWNRSLEVASPQEAIAETTSLVRTAVEGKDKKRRDLLLSIVNLSPSQAVQVLAPEVKSHSRDHVLVALLARAYLHSSDPEKALEVLEASRRVGKKPEITYLAARANLRLKDTDKALELFESLWKENKGYRDTQVFLVSLYAARGRFQEAIVHLEAWEGVRQAGAILALLGKYHLLAGQFLDAVSYLERAARGRLPLRLRTEVGLALKRIVRKRR